MKNGNKKQKPLKLSLKEEYRIIIINQKNPYLLMNKIPKKKVQYIFYKKQRILKRTVLQPKNNQVKSNQMIINKNNSLTNKKKKINYCKIQQKKFLKNI